MIKLIYRPREIDFSALMLVYAQSIEENAEEFYPNEERNMALMRAEEDFCRYVREEFFSVPGSFYAICEQDGQYISALRMEPYKDGLLLEALETRPESRRKGYAVALLREVLEGLDSVRVYSHVSKKNTASLKTHLACGFRRVLEHAVCIDGSVSRKLCTLYWERETTADF